MKHTLHEIASEYRDTLEQIGDLDLSNEDVMDALAALQGDLKQKIRAVLLYTQNLEVIAAARLNAAATMLAGGKRLMDRCDSMRSYVQANIQGASLSLPLEFPEFRVNLAKLPPSVEVTVPAEQLPGEYVKVELTIKGTARELAPLLAQLNEDKSSEHVALTVERGAVQIEQTAMKRELLSDLKEGVLIEGVKVNPTGYRLTVK